MGWSTGSITGSITGASTGSITGSEAMQHVAAEMVRAMSTAPLLSMFVVPAVYLLLRRKRVRNSE